MFVEVKTSVKHDKNAPFPHPRHDGPVHALHLLVPRRHIAALISLHAGDCDGHNFFTILSQAFSRIIFTGKAQARSVGRRAHATNIPRMLGLLVGKPAGRLLVCELPGKSFSPARTFQQWRLSGLDQMRIVRWGMFANNRPASRF
jgi:hypothetical protein